MIRFANHRDELTTMEDKIFKALEETKTLLAQKQDEFDGRLKQAITETKSEFETRIADEATKLVDLQEKVRNMEAASKRPASNVSEEDEIKKEYNAKFNEYLRTGRSQGLIDLQSKAMSTVNDPSGGFLVPVEYSNLIITRNFETSPIRQLATVITIGSKSVEMLIDDNEADAEWMSEMGTRNNTNNPLTGLKEITVHELHARPKASNAMLEDGSFDIASYLTGKVSDKFGRTENTAFVSGNGVGKPEGFLSLPNYDNAGVYQRNCIERINSGSSGAFTATGLQDAQNSLKEIYQANASWGFKRSAFGSVAKLKDSQQRPLFGFGFDPATAGQQLLILGKPVYFMDDMEAVASGAKAAVYGDFKAGYTIVDRLGITALKDPYTAPGHVIWDFRKRVGGGVTNFEALKIQVLS